MNPTLELHFWLRLLGILALEISLVIALAFAAQTFIRSAFWRRAVWQITFVCLLLLAGAELTGVGRGISVWVAGKPVPERKVSVRLVPTDEQFIPMPVETEMPEPAFVPQKETPVARSVWWPGILWLAGFGLIAARILCARIFLTLLRRRKPKITDDLLLNRVSELAQQLGLRRKVHLLETSGLSSPMTFGVVWPGIGLPSGFAQKFTPAQQNAMLAHELAHLAARDPFWYLLADVAAALLWWQPLVWWARRRLHSASEHAADEAAALLENGPGTLAECLVQLGRQMTRARSFGWLGVDGSGFRSHLGQRVERLLNLKEARQPLRGRKILFAKTGFTILFAALVIFTSGWIQNREEPREKNLPATVQKSWKSSFASTAMAAWAAERTELMAKNEVQTPPEIPKPASSTLPKTNSGDEVKSDVKIAAARLVQDGKLLFEMGKLEEAEIKLNAALKIDAENKAAFYYKSLIQESKSRRLVRPRVELIHPTIPPKALDKTTVGGPPAKIATNSSPVRTNSVYTSNGRKKIRAKLDSIRLNEVSFEDVPLGEVLKSLRAESKKHDPEGRGVNFLYNPHAYEPGAPTNDPNAAASTPVAAAPVDLNRITVYLSPALKDRRLADVLDAIVHVSDPAIEYRIEDYAIIFSPKAAGELNLYTRVFKLNSKKFIEILENAFPGDAGGLDDQTGNRSNESIINRRSEINRKGRAYFEAAGVDFVSSGSANGKSVLFNERAFGDPAGLLMVRATLDDLEIIQTTLEHVKDLVISPGLPDAQNLQTRVFKVNPQTFSKSLGEVAPQNMASRIRDFLSAAGVDFGTETKPNGKTIYYKDRTGWLMVRAPSDDLKKIERALAPFPPEPLQLTIEAKFVEIGEATMKKLGMDWFTQKAVFSTTNLAASDFFVKGTNVAEAKIAVTKVPNNSRPGVAGIFTESQYQIVLKALEEAEGVDVLAAPKVTTLSGRQAQISILDAHSIVTGVGSFTNTNGISTNGFKTENLSTGPVLDVLPTVSEDGYSIQMSLMGSVSEFLGYVAFTRQNLEGKPVDPSSPQPQMRLRTMTSNVSVWDGQTVMLAQEDQSKSVLKRKNLFVFVTAKIIDAKGNLVHSGKEMHLATNSVPKQPVEKE